MTALGAERTLGLPAISPKSQKSTQFFSQMRTRQSGAVKDLGKRGMIKPWCLGRAGSAMRVIAVISQAFGKQA
jgi:hypothetical protein